MKQLSLSILLTVLMSIVGAKAYGYDIEAKNADGVTIYYNYINNGTELEVAGCSFPSFYSGVVVIPESVTYMNRTRRVTSICESAFKDDIVKSVTIPNSVTSIGTRAFYGCSYLTSVTIPNSVTTIGIGAFEDCSSLTSVAIPNSVTSIEPDTFHGCSSLTSVTIPNSVTSIGESAFLYCQDLTSVTIPNSVTSIGESAFRYCQDLTSVTIPNSVTSIERDTFHGCSSLTSVTIPNSVTSIGESAFLYCQDLTSVTIPNSVTSIGESAFYGCSRLTSVTIPNSVTSIGGSAFGGWGLFTVISLIENPFAIGYGTFSDDTFMNATLYVPVGSIDKYKATSGWNKFLFIEEGTGGEGPTTPKKCETPSISYQNGKLIFDCSTEGATCQYNISDTDIKAGTGNEVDLTVTYIVNVYASKSGYEDSNVASATLCWIDAEPKTGGITEDVAQVRANAVLIQSENGRITVNGVDEGKIVSVYSPNGVLCGTTISQNGNATINTTLPYGSIAIIKIGEKSVKVVLK